MSGVVVVNQLSTEIVNSDGYSAVVMDGESVSGRSLVLISGSDGYQYKAIRVNSSGAILVETTGVTAQPISGAVSQSGIWTVRTQDGYGQPFLVKTTAAVAGDPALVVATIPDGYVQAIYEHDTPGVSVRTSITNTVTPTVFLSANLNRKGATIYNRSNRTLLIATGAVNVSVSDFTMQIASLGYYELPYGFTGKVSGVWASSGTNNAIVTEFS